MLGPSEAEFAVDRRLQWQVERGLQLVAQACIDLGDEILFRLGAPEPDTAPAIFVGLRDAGVVDAELAGRLQACIRFRNVLVHDYDDLDPREVFRHWREDLDHYGSFCAAVRHWIGSVEGAPP